jgi:hypothetical protein
LVIKNKREVNEMEMQLMEDEKKVVCNALNIYLSELRGESVKTEKYDMKVDLHRERDIIKKFIERC